jgi:hypothetical protein
LHTGSTEKNLKTEMKDSPIREISTEQNFFRDNFAEMPVSFPAISSLLPTESQPFWHPTRDISFGTRNYVNGSMHPEETANQQMISNVRDFPRTMRSPLRIASNDPNLNQCPIVAGSILQLQPLLALLGTFQAPPSHVFNSSWPSGVQEPRFLTGNLVSILPF